MKTSTKIYGRPRTRLALLSELKCGYCPLSVKPWRDKVVSEKSHPSATTTTMTSDSDDPNNATHSDIHHFWTTTSNTTRQRYEQHKLRDM